MATISASLDDQDLAAARPLASNAGLCFMGVTPGNDGFTPAPNSPRNILAQDPASAAVIRPFLIGRDLSRDHNNARPAISSTSAHKPSPRPPATPAPSSTLSIPSAPPAPRTRARPR